MKNKQYRNRKTFESSRYISKNSCKELYVIDVLLTKKHQYIQGHSLKICTFLHYINYHLYSYCLHLSGNLPDWFTATQSTMCISLISLLLATGLIIYWLCSYSRYFFVKAIFICLLFLTCKCVYY